MTSNTLLYDLTVEGYRFCRSDGKPFDSSVMTYIPAEPAVELRTIPPRAAKVGNAFWMRKANDRRSLHDDYDDAAEDDENLFHNCQTDVEPAGRRGDETQSFVLAHRCEPMWSTLSDQQKDVIETVEREVKAYREDGIFFRSVIVEGLGGCGKTRLMAYVVNHSPDNTHVLYLTKQNKRLQDFLYDELDKGELVPPEPVLDMSKCSASDFWNVSQNVGGRYACSVEKLVYNVCGHEEARQTDTRKALQWKMNIPDALFDNDDKIKTSKSNVVVLLDEYTMISPPLLHKMLHCVRLLFSAPTVLIMGGDRFQLGPIGWDARGDKNYTDRCGEKAPVGAATENNRYYVSDVREELKTRLRQEPFEYRMSGSQRCRDDPLLAKMVVYLRDACRNSTSVKAVERRMVAFGFSRGIRLFRCIDQFRGRCKAGQLVVSPESVDNKREELEEGKDPTDDDAAAATAFDADDEDRHLGDDDLRDTSVIQIDWSSPPTVDLVPFINFYTSLYEEIYLAYKAGRLYDAALPKFVYDRSSSFANNSFPVFMVKKNEKCNILSDTFLKMLYNGVYTELSKKYPAVEDTVGSADETEAKRIKLEGGGGGEGQRPHSDVETFLKRFCVSISVSDRSPVQQTMMVGVPYRMTDTLKSFTTPVVSNGELVLLTAIHLGTDMSVESVLLKTLQRQTDHFLLVAPGLTHNRLHTAAAGVNFKNAPDAAYMLPLVPMVCENIYQMQGNTIVSDCFVDLLSTKVNDIYVAVSRFRKTASIKGIVLS